MLAPYLVLTEVATGALHALVFFEPFTHRQVAEAFLTTHAPRSGGWCRLYPDRAAACVGWVVDLDLVPDRSDGVLLFALVRATARASILAATPKALPA